VSDKAATRARLRATSDAVATKYADARATYPEEVFDALVAATGIGPGSRLLEVGCGPGTATLPLARLGCRTTAVELGAGLAAEARRRLAAYPDVDVVTGSFETWPWGERSFDLVHAATAWQWVDLRCGTGARTRCCGRTGTWPSERPSTCCPRAATRSLPRSRRSTRRWARACRRHVLAGRASSPTGPRRSRPVACSARDHLHGEIRRRLALRPDGLLRRHWGAVLHVAAPRVHLG